MAQNQLRTPDAVGPIRNRDARRVCSLSGLDTARQRVVSLQQLGDTLDYSIRELELEKRREKSIEKAFLVLRFTKASCDAFISIAADLGKLVFGEATGEEMEKIDAGYGVTSSVAQAVGMSIAGQKVDVVKRLQMPPRRVSLA